MKRLLISLIAGAVVLFSQINPSPAQCQQCSNMNIADTLYYSGQFCKFTDMLERADLNRVLKGRGPYTVFAPTDAALANTPPQLISQLISCGNEWQLNRTMKYHYLKDGLSGSQIAILGHIRTADGTCLSACPACNALRVNNVNVVQSIYTKNGVIHVVDNILLPNQQISLR